MSDLTEAAARLLTEKHYDYWESNRNPGAVDDARKVATWAAKMLDETPIDEAFLRSVGFKDWDCADGDEYDMWHPANSELSWKCRLAWIANGMYVVRMCDPDDSEYDGVSESVELFDSRNSTKVVTRGQLRMLCQSLGIELKESR